MLIINATHNCTFEKVFLKLVGAYENKKLQVFQKTNRKFLLSARVQVNNHRYQAYGKDKNEILVKLARNIVKGEISKFAVQSFKQLTMSY